MSYETPAWIETLNGLATLENAKKWEGLTDKFIFCQDLLNTVDLGGRMSDNTEGLVGLLEERFEHTLQEEKREAHRQAYKRVTRTAVLRSLTEAEKRGYHLVKVWDGEETAWTAKRVQDRTLEKSGKMPAWQDAARLDRKGVIEAATAAESCNLVFLHKDDKAQRITLAWEWGNLNVNGKTPTERYAEALVDGAAPLELHPVLNEIMEAAGAMQ